MTDQTPELYHYTNCGLDYVYLCNGYDLRETRHGQGIAIHQADGLHQAIARSVITSTRPLRGQEVRFLRSMLKLSQQGLARVLGVRRLTVARWEGAPDTKIPGAADRALRLFYSLKAEGNDALAQQICVLLTEMDDIKHKMATLKLNLRETDHGWRKEAA